MLESQSTMSLLLNKFYGFVFNWGQRLRLIIFRLRGNFCGESVHRLSAFILKIFGLCAVMEVRVLLRKARTKIMGQELCSSAGAYNVHITTPDIQTENPRGFSSYLILHIIFSCHNSTRLESIHVSESAPRSLYILFESIKTVVWLWTKPV